MRRIWKKCNVLAVCICLLFCGVISPIEVFANDATVSAVEPRMTYIYSYSTDVSISSDGVATITGMVRGKSGVTSTYVKEKKKKSESGSWKDVKSWEDSNNTRSTTIAETYQVSKGEYRVTMTCSANTETKTATSASRTY